MTTGESILTPKTKLQTSSLRNSFLESRNDETLPLSPERSSGTNTKMKNRIEGLVHRRIEELLLCCYLIIMSFY